MGKQKTSRVVFAHITIGLQLAIIVLIFVYGGYWLDEHYMKSPLFVSLGAFIGMALGFYHLIKDLNRETSREEKEKNDNYRKIKWM